LPSIPNIPIVVQLNVRCSGVYVGSGIVVNAGLIPP